jgi:carbon storage regulator CsrA
MLVLSRKTQQQIQIGPHVTITILKVKGETVRIGIEAPQEVCVLRSEVAEKLVHGTSVTDGETEATVRSALAATERERARTARIAGKQPPVARRSSRVEFSSSFAVGHTSHTSLRSHLAARSSMATSTTRPVGMLSGGLAVGAISAGRPVQQSESSTLGSPLEMSIR